MKATTIDAPKVYKKELICAPVGKVGGGGTTLAFDADSAKIINIFICEHKAEVI
ncbi:MAG: hypothetical protein ACYTXC_08980 [Nostoc sp.]